ncbi:MAG: hypothetical protein M1828_001033 [Chrysothrix sp. TS-e1954]|nr:MAG: hypothetical protein M1828_001033 [Chrysothrix sp. TS-e1954]
MASPAPITTPGGPDEEFTVESVQSKLQHATGILSRKVELLMPPVREKELINCINTLECYIRDAAIKDSELRLPKIRRAAMFARKMESNWRLKRTLAGEVSTPEHLALIDKVLTARRAALARSCLLSLSPILSVKVWNTEDMEVLWSAVSLLHNRSLVGPHIDAKVTELAMQLQQEDERESEAFKGWYAKHPM